MRVLLPIVTSINLKGVVFMGRHATVAGRQAASAAARARVFTKVAREITVAAKVGNSGDPNSNPRLRLAIEKAREANMPKDNVERAIKKGLGELEGASYEEITYEGYGPGGTAFLIEVMTDNRNRTQPELRRLFQKGGGNLAEMGAVAWMFKRKGVIDINASNASEEKVMEVALDAGAEDIIGEEGLVSVYCDATNFASVRDAITKAGIAIERGGLEMVPETKIDLSGDNAKAALELFEKLEEHDDSQAVYHNFNISKEEMERLGFGGSKE